MLWRQFYHLLIWLEFLVVIYFWGSLSTFCLSLSVGVVCAAPVTGSVWQRAQVIQYNGESGTSHIRYVDNGGYDTVNSAILRQIRSGGSKFGLILCLWLLIWIWYLKILFSQVRLCDLTIPGSRGSVRQYHAFAR